MKEEDFKLRKLNELSCKGGFRSAWVEPKGLEFSEGLFRFSLPKGSYATVVLKEFVEDG